MNSRQDPHRERRGGPADGVRFFGRGKKVGEAGNIIDPFLTGLADPSFSGFDIK